MSDVPNWIAAIAAGVGVAGAALGVWWQLRRQRRHAAEERTLRLHEQLTSGEIGAARDRFSSYMWSTGGEHQPGRCWIPSWEQLLGVDFARGLDEADLSAYPEELRVQKDQTPLRDLYKILWCFERIHVSIARGLLDLELAAGMLGSHTVWWDALCRRIPARPETTSYREPLQLLAQIFLQRDPSLATAYQEDFVESA